MYPRVSPLDPPRRHEGLEHEREGHVVDDVLERVAAAALDRDRADLAAVRDPRCIERRDLAGVPAQDEVVRLDPAPRAQELERPGPLAHDHEARQGCDVLPQGTVVKEGHCLLYTSPSPRDS